MQRNAALRRPIAGPDAQVVAKEPLQVRIPATVKRRFKAHAALRGIEPNQLFVEMWEQYERSHTVDGGRHGREGQG